MDRLILVANSEWALLIGLSGHSIVSHQEIEHLESREKVSNLVSDSPGRSSGRGAHSLNEGQDIKEHERHKFALQLARVCNKMHEEIVFRKLILVAGPKFLGELRRSFKHSLASCIEKEIAKEPPRFWTWAEKIHHIAEWIEIPIVDKALERVLV